MKIKCKECNGEGAYEYACWETSRMINCECSYCDGQGYYEEDIEEFKSVTNVDEICDKITGDYNEDYHYFMSFTGNASRTYHITYFISRGDVTAEETPLLGGMTLNASSITHAITNFITTTGIEELEIKYIVEL